MNIKNKIFDPFGNIKILKKILIFIIGIITYKKYNSTKKLKIYGSKNILHLPRCNVLFVSNHQTYFADVFAIYHVLSSVKNGFIDNINNPLYLINPESNLYYIAAEETMKNSILTRIFAYAGAITVKRTWKKNGIKINRKVDINEINKIDLALREGWVLSFPQGTTTQFAPGRRGTVHIIKKNKPIVIPIVIDKFNIKFDKKGLKTINKNIIPCIRFKEPIKIDFENDTSEYIMKKIMFSIEQSKEFH